MSLFGQDRISRTLLKRTTLVACVMLLSLTACDGPGNFEPMCRDAGGHIERRMTSDDATVVFCVFPNGMECSSPGYYNGDCTLPERDASPLATPPLHPTARPTTMPPAAPISPLATPEAAPATSALPIDPLTNPLITGPTMGYAAVAPPPPASMDDLLQQAPLIVVGEVGPVEQYTELTAYGDDGYPMIDAEGNVLPGTPATEFQLNIEEVIRDDGTLGGDRTVTLRVVGHSDAATQQATASTEYPLSYTGDRHIFLLTPYPDGDAYGLYYGPWSRLTVIDDRLHISNGDQDPLQFDGDYAPYTLDEFVEIVEDTPPPGIQISVIPPATRPTHTPTPTPSATPTAIFSPLPTPEGILRDTSVRYNPPSSITLRAPDSLSALLGRAPLIVIGEVGPIEQYTEFESMATSASTTDAQGNVVPGQPVVNLLLDGMPMTEFRLNVKEVLRDDGTIAAGEPVILRAIGHITEETAEATQESAIPATFTGDRYLFLLSPYPDDQAYAFYFNAYSRLIIDGDILRVSNGDQDPLVFDDSDDPVTLEEFMQAVGAADGPTSAAPMRRVTVVPQPTSTPVPTEPIRTPTPGSQAACQGPEFMITPPPSLEALIEESELIFIGEVGPVEQYLEEGGTGPVPEWIPRGTDPAPLEGISLTATDLRLQIERLIRADARVTRGELVILRMPWLATAESKERTQSACYPLSYTGDRHLFLLSYNEEMGVYLLPKGPWNRLIIDGDILRLSNGSREPLEFANSDGPVTLEAFMEVVGAP